MLVREGKGRKSNIVERDSSMVSQVMNIKILQAAEEEKEEEHRYHKMKKEIWKVIPWDSNAGWDFRLVLRREISGVWVEGKLSSRRLTTCLPSMEE